MSSSGTYDFSPSLASMVLDAYDRLEIRPASLTADQMISARMSLNMVQVRWANRGVNLFLVDLQTAPLVQGSATYDVPESTVMMLEAYIRNYSLNDPVDATPDFDTTASSRTVTVNLADNGFLAGYWTQIIVPVSIGGIILLGYYQVVSATTDTYTITAAEAATATESGGAVPIFDTTASSDSVTITLPDHGYLPGQSFTVQVQTDVGGISLLGAYTIDTVPTADTFTFTAPYSAGSTDTESENGGEAQIAGQSASTQPTDRLISPFSRTDYAAVASKFQQAPPTSFYFDRTISPTVTLWPTPDGNGPYELRYYRMRQLQDANPQGLETGDIPYRALEAMTAELAAHLAIKWKPEKREALAAYAKECWEEFSYEDRQRVRLTMAPDFSGYFRS